MNIIEHTYAFAAALTKRSKTTDLIMHHAAAARCSVTDVHKWHLQNGWSGIGYHFLVRKDGSIHRGRPIDTVGAHTYGKNSDSIGVCFEGNFETETMSAAQKQAGAELVTYIRNLFPSIKTVGKHRDYCSTACPGKNFPFDFIAAGVKVENKPAETKKDDTPTLTACNTGQALTLKNEPLFATAYTDKKAGSVYGTFYVWSGTVINGRIRITNEKSKVGISGQVTGWIDAPPITYTVKSGDTLNKIAKKYSTTASKIAKDNGIKNVNLIFPGQVLKILR